METKGEKEETTRMPACLSVCLRVKIEVAIGMDPDHNSSTLYADIAAADDDDEEDSLRFSTAITGIRMPVP